MELFGCSSKLAFWDDACKSNAFQGILNPCEIAFIEGTGKSKKVDAEHVVWRYPLDGAMYYFTNTFTVLSQRLFGDLDLDGDVDVEDRALHRSLSDDHGWVMPVAGNVFRKVQLRTDVGVPGVHVLSLRGSENFRVWRSPHPATNDVPLLVAGQVATNGLNGVSWGTASSDYVYIEALGGGSAILTYAFIGTNDAAGIVCRTSLKMTAVPVDLDVDANGDGTLATNAGNRRFLKKLRRPETFSGFSRQVLGEVRRCVARFVAANHRRFALFPARRAAF